LPPIASTTRDELDFDLTAFRYVNIGRSYRGVEVGTSLSTASGTLVFANFSRQSALAESGQFEGHQLKAIPRSIASAGGDFRLWRGIAAGVVVSSVGGAFVDDGNVTPLAGYTRADLRVGIPAGRVRLTLDAMERFRPQVRRDRVSRSGGLGGDLSVSGGGSRFCGGVGLALAAVQRDSKAETRRSAIVRRLVESVDQLAAV
jgi:hypothetical protein